MLFQNFIGILNFELIQWRFGPEIIYNYFKLVLFMQYQEIHVWDFPPTETYLRINDKYRTPLIRDFIDSFRSWKAAISFLNKQGRLYGLEKRYSVGALSHWRMGVEKTRKRTRNIPLWVALEISKVLSNNISKDNEVMQEIERKLEYCNSRGRGIPVKMRFPLFLTPELVSVIFHLYGDGCVGDRGQTSHYRQKNEVGLANFLSKLRNCFGNFSVSKITLKDSKVIIPKVIIEFYKYYFGLAKHYLGTTRIPEEIKALPKSFLVAGLTAFIVDEGHIGDTIEIYSSNKELLEDIKEIILSLGYCCYGPRKKSKNTPKDFRIYISVKDALKFNADINAITNEFQTCGLAHKSEKLSDIVRRKIRLWKTKDYGVTKNEIVNILTKQNQTVTDLCREINIAPSSLREHLRALENQGFIHRIGKHNNHADLWSKIM